ncbi:MAG: hypothetical protein ABI867_28795 [Kofleriaceae bacterium]
MPRTGRATGQRRARRREQLHVREHRARAGAWGLDLAVLDVQRGHDEGVHELARVTAYTTILPGLWLGGGGSYGLVRGWTDAALPARAGAGFAIDAVAGYDLPSESILRVFVQLAVTVPVFAALDRYGGEDSDVHVVAAELAVGVRL